MAAAGIGLLILAHLADYATFVVMVLLHGLDAEMNPIVVTLIESGGLAILTMAKTATVLLVASTFLVVGRHRPRMAASVLMVGIFIGGFGAYSNLITIQA